MRVAASGQTTSPWDKDLEAHQRIIDLVRDGRIEPGSRVEVVGFTSQFVCHDSKPDGTPHGFSMFLNLRRSAGPRMSILNREYARPPSGTDLASICGPTRAIWLVTPALLLLSIPID